VDLDVVNYWTEVKLDIVREYASAYSKIMAKQSNPELYHMYIDGFAGAGRHIAKNTGKFVQGSPLNALSVSPPFREYHLIDLDKDKASLLRSATKGVPNVHVYDEDCNTVLLKEVFPLTKYESYRRALSLLDPYGLHLNWQVTFMAGQMRSIEIFLNFPMVDINRNVLWRNPEKVSPTQAKRMTDFWGDESWRAAAYDTTTTLWPLEMKTDNARVVEAFRQRLMNVAGFKYVPHPMPMRNSTNATVYYLFFASQKPAANHIIEDIFSKHRA